MKPIGAKRAISGPPAANMATWPINTPRATSRTGRSAAANPDPGIRPLTTTIRDGSTVLGRRKNHTRAAQVGGTIKEKISQAELTPLVYCVSKESLAARRIGMKGIRYNRRMSQFKNMKFVVTGGSSGIGLAIARHLSDRGAELCLAGRRQEALDAAVSSIGGNAWAVQCDVGDEHQVDALAKAVAQRWSSLDGLVNNAGIAPMADLEATEPEVWDLCFRINTRGPYLLIRALLGLLRQAEAPAIVNISSTLAEKAIPGMAAYNSAKAALNQMTRSIALELAPKIRANAIMPAVVDTPIHSGRGMSEADVHGMGSFHPLKRIGRPEDIAELTAFLLSDAASWMTGAIIPVDGGMMAG